MSCRFYSACFSPAFPKPLFNVLQGGAYFDRLSEVDDFISKLWHIHLAVKDEGYTQVNKKNIFYNREKLSIFKNLTLGIFRSDYMVHVNPSEGDGKSQIKQVEFNTIASSFGGLSDLVCKLHR